MAIDLDDYQLHGVQRFRAALFQELLDHTDTPQDALKAAIDAEGWITGKVGESADLFQPHLLREAVRPIVLEMFEQSVASFSSAAPVGTSIPVAIAESVGQSATLCDDGSKADGAAEADPETSLLPAGELHKASGAPAPDGDNLLRKHDAKIREMADAGWTYEAIAEAVELSPGYVRIRAKEIGVEPRKPGPQPAAANAGGKPRAVLNVKGHERRAKLEKLWKAGISPVLIAKKIGYASADSVKATALYHMKLGLQPKLSREEEEAAVAKFIAENGILSQPDFGDDEINALYPRLRERGHTLKKVAPEVTGPRRFILNDSSYALTRDGLISRAKEIITTEKPLKAVAP